VDETGLRVEGEGRFVHVASTTGLTHYSCDKRRGKAAMDEIGILPAFKGVSVQPQLGLPALAASCCNPVMSARSGLCVGDYGAKKHYW
jgi:hypothetical protein